MKAIVFGGSGFLGSHVADALTEAGYKTVIYDIVASPYVSRDQEMVVGDILDADKIDEVVRGADVVYNFAGIADIDEASRRPLDSVKLNILGNSNVLEACRKTGVQRYVFASSIYVYSKSGGFYRSTKQACELLIENYGEVYGVPYTVLRYGSLYGPRADRRNAIQSFITQAVTKGRIVRYGDGEELREYVHVNDAARGSVDILDDEFKNQHVIITGYQKMRVRDVLVMIREMFEKKIELEFLPSNESYHYEVTPYTFTPKIGRRLTSKSYLDLGQGLLSTIHDVYKEHNPLPTWDGIILKEAGEAGDPMVEAPAEPKAA